MNPVQYLSTLGWSIRPKKYVHVIEYNDGRESEVFTTRHKAVDRLIKDGFIPSVFPYELVKGAYVHSDTYRHPDRKVPTGEKPVYARLERFEIQ